MIILRPIKINDTSLIESNVEENDAPEWNASTAYSNGANVMRTGDGIHSVYRSLHSNNTGNFPENDSLTQPEHWARVSATNRWAMFSDQLNDQTEQTESIVISVVPGTLMDGISFFGLDAGLIEISVNDPVDGDVYKKQFPLIDSSGVNNWHSWYFEPVIREDTLAVLDLPAYAAATVTIEIRNLGGVAKSGLISMGSQMRIGDADYGTGIGIVDYSRKERDSFGNAVVVQRNFTRRADYRVTVETSFVGTLQNTLSRLRTIPLTWIGSIHYPSTVVYGYFRDFNIVLDNPTTSQLSIDVEGLT